MNKLKKINIGLIISFLLAIIFILLILNSLYLELNPKFEKFYYSDNYFSSENIEIFILPRKEALNKILFEINNAKSEIHCALRSLNYEDLENEFIEKNKTIKVRLFVNQDYRGNTRIYLPFVKFEERNVGMMHNSYCVIDGEKVITGSLIFNENTIHKNIHDVLIINSKELAKQYNNNFWRIYNNQSNENIESVLEFIKINDNTFIKPHFCPYENCEEIILYELNNSKYSVKSAVYSFTSQSVIDFMKRSNNIEKKVVLEPLGLTENSIFFQRFNWVRQSRIIENVHTKLITIDTNTVITGSMNLSYFGMYYNEENFLIIKNEEINKFYSKFIDYLYENSR